MRDFASCHLFWNVLQRSEPDQPFQIPVPITLDNGVIVTGSSVCLGGATHADSQAILGPPNQFVGSFTGLPSETPSRMLMAFPAITPRLLMPVSRPVESSSISFTILPLSMGTKVLPALSPSLDLRVDLLHWSPENLSASFPSYMKGEVARVDDPRRLPCRHKKGQPNASALATESPPPLSPPDLATTTNCNKPTSIMPASGDSCGSEPDRSIVRMTPDQLSLLVLCPTTRGEYNPHGAQVADQQRSRSPPVASSAAYTRNLGRVRMGGEGGKEDASSNLSTPGHQGDPPTGEPESKKWTSFDDSERYRDFKRNKYRPDKKTDYYGTCNRCFEKQAVCTIRTNAATGCSACVVNGETCEFRRKTFQHLSSGTRYYTQPTTTAPSTSYY